LNTDELYAHDCGQALNPEAVEGQLQGSIITLKYDYPPDPEGPFGYRTSKAQRTIMAYAYHDLFDNYFYRHHLVFSAAPAFRGTLLNAYCSGVGPYRINDQVSNPVFGNAL
jgi:hypothetical protein